MNKHDRAYSVSSNATNIEIYNEQRHSANNNIEGENDLNHRLASIHEEQGGSNQGSLISQGKKGSPEVQLLLKDRSVIYSHKKKP